MKNYKDRIIGLERVKASQLTPHEKNFRRHNDKQKQALAGVLREVGYADALLARKDKKGNLILIDGHLRAEISPDQEVPVLVLDVDEKEADYILATLDNLAGLADTDEGAFEDLVMDLEVQSKVVREMLLGIFDDTETVDEKTIPVDKGELFGKALQLKPRREYVVVVCENEQEWNLLKEFLELKDTRKGGQKKKAPFETIDTERVVTASRLFAALEDD